MKILFDARAIGQQMHGIGRYAFNLLRQLLAEDRGHEFLVLSNGAEIQKRFPPSPWVRFLPTKVPLYSLQEQFLIPVLLGKEIFDLYHSPTYTIPLVLAPKGILTIHDLIHLLFPGDYGLGHRLFYRLVVQRAVSRCRKVLTVSESSKNDIMKLLRVDGNKIIITPNGLAAIWEPTAVENDFKDRFGLAPVYLLFVGNPRPHKNFTRVLQAYEILVKEDLYPGRLVAVGISEQKVPEPIRDRLVFLPRCQDDDLVRLYSGADLLLAPSLYEGFGLPVLEAMACGCPVLIGTEGALPEIAGEAGLAVNPYQVLAIVEGMRKVLHDKDLGRKMGKLGLNRAAGFGWEKTGRIALEVYESLAS